MNELELKNIWDAYNSKLDASLSINREVLREVKKTKVNKLVSSIRPIRLVAIIIGVCWTFFIDCIAILAFLSGNYFLFISAGIHSLVTKIAIGISIYHLILIHQINAADSIVRVQKKIAKFKLSTLNGIRLSCLQLPVFTTFYLHDAMFIGGNTGLLLLQIAITLLFTYAGIWCYKNITLANSETKWFKFLFDDNEWRSLAKAEDILGQLATLEEEESKN
jgi:hypothetical protein